MNDKQTIQLGKLIKEVDIRKNDNDISVLLGVTISKKFIPSVANTIGTDLKNYKVIKKGLFACSLMQVSRDGGIAMALYKDDIDAIMSPAYFIFSADENIVLSEYLELVLLNSEFDREAVFHAVGGVRGTLTWDEFCEIEVEIPCLSTQQEIVDKKKMLEKKIEILTNLSDEALNFCSLLYEKYVENSESNMHVSDIGYFFRGKNITSDEMIPGNFDVISAGISPSGKHNEFNVTGESITVSGSGVNAGHVLLHFDNIWAADCSFCNSAKSLYFLYESLIHSKEAIEILRDGFTGQQHVYASDINSIEIPFVEENKIQEYHDKTKDYFNLIKRNNKEIKEITYFLSTLVH